MGTQLDGGRGEQRVCVLHVCTGARVDGAKCLACAARRAVIQSDEQGEVWEKLLSAPGERAPRTSCASQRFPNTHQPNISCPRKETEQHVVILE